MVIGVNFIEYKIQLNFVNDFAFYCKYILKCVYVLITYYVFCNMYKYFETLMKNIILVNQSNLVEFNLVYIDCNT